jgi:hypothetical protein
LPEEFFEFGLGGEGKGKQEYENAHRFHFATEGGVVASY